MRQGWIEKRAGKKGVSFRVSYWVPDGHGGLAKRSKSFPAWALGGEKKARDEARAFLARMQTEVRAGTWETPVTMTLAELLDRWLAVRMEEVSESTIYGYRLNVRKHLAPYPALVGTPLPRLTGLQLQTHYAHLSAAGVGAPTIAVTRRIVKAALNAAKRWRLIKQNPADDVTKPAERERELRFWTPEQSAAFLALEGTDPRYGLIWRLMLLTGMRVGELMALRWSDLDFQRGTLTIARTVTRNLKGQYVIGETTKSANSRRTMTIPASCVEPLKQHRVRQRERQLAAPTWSTEDGDVVFTQARTPGRRLRYQTLVEQFTAAVARAGLPPITMHGMRHSFATAMLVNGVHPKVVASLLGDTVEMVLRVYSHVIESTRQDAIAALDAQLAVLADGAALPGHATSDAT